MCGKIWKQAAEFLRRHARQMFFYGGLAVVLCAAAVCAEQYRTGNNAETEPAPVSAAEMCTPSPTPAAQLSENAEILREYAAAPRWNERLSLYETHDGTDLHFAGGSVLSVSEGTVRAVEENALEIESGEIAFTYRGIKPAPEIVPGTRVNVGDFIGTENGSVENWMEPHVHLEVKINGENADFMGKLVKNVF